MTTHHDPPILVVGGSGKTGRRVAERLAAAGRTVRPASRRTEPAFDWDDPATWQSAVAGVRAAYVTFAPDLGFPGAAERVGAFATMAAEAGVERLVLLSGRGEAGAARSEEAVRAAGVPTTILRASWFDQNFSEHFLLEPVLKGEIALPAADVAEPFVDADDIAAVAVAALTEDRHVGELYELTGPRALTFAEVATVLTEVTGRAIRYVPVAPDEFVAGLTGEGVPLDEATALADLFAAVLDGRNVATADGVSRALGRPARDFAGFARAAAAAGVGRAEGVVSDRALTILTVVAAVGTGLAGGVFFAFSTFVMRALDRLPAASGLSAMQSVNVTAVGPGLMIELFGTAAVCAVVGGAACFRWGQPAAAYQLAGALAYLVLVIGVTAAYHVPHNDALAALDPAAPASAGPWARYVTGWTAWNHLRTAGGAAAAVLFTLAARAA